MKRTLSMILFLVVLLLLSLVGVNGLPYQPSVATVGQRTAGENAPASPPNDLNDSEQQIIRAVANIPYLTNVLFDTGEDGKINVVSMADVTREQDPNKQKLARTLAHQFIMAVYGTGLPISAASIHVSDGDRLILGASLGSIEQKKLTQSTFASAGTGEFIQFLRQHEQESSQPEQSTWFYEIL